MKEFKEDKKKLEKEIGEKLSEFCKKYGVDIEDIELTSFYHYQAGNDFEVEIKVDL